MNFKSSELRVHLTLLPKPPWLAPETWVLFAGWSYRNVGTDGASNEYIWFTYIQRIYIYIYIYSQNSVHQCRQLTISAEWRVHKCVRLGIVGSLASTRGATGAHRDRAARRPPARRARAGAAAARAGRGAWSRRARARNPSGRTRWAARRGSAPRAPPRWSPRARPEVWPARRARTRTPPGSPPRPTPLHAWAHAEELTGSTYCTYCETGVCRRGEHLLQIGYSEYVSPNTVWTNWKNMKKTFKTSKVRYVKSPISCLNTKVRVILLKASCKGQFCNNTCRCLHYISLWKTRLSEQTKLLKLNISL